MSRLWIFVSLIALTHCSGLRDEDGSGETATGPLLVGRVASVHPGAGFVLVGRRRSTDERSS